MKDEIAEDEKEIHQLKMALFSIENALKIAEGRLAAREGRLAERVKKEKQDPSDNDGSKKA